MRIQQFLEHHGIASNPFSDEDAQTDRVFKEHCLSTTYYPAWDKIYGDPSDPSTSIVFGEKGAGKTAMRLQIATQLAEHNRRHPDQRVFAVEYDDFNPFLDRFRESLGTWARRGDKVLSHWKLWDHMDALLSLIATKLVDEIVGDASPASGAKSEGTKADGSKSDLGHLAIDRLDRWQHRDLLLLAACYDRSSSETFSRRWSRLRRKLRYSTWRSYWDLALGILGSLLVFGVVAGTHNWNWLASIWPYLIAGAMWVPRLWRTWKGFWQARGVARSVRVIHHEVNPLRRVFMQFPADDILGQPLPNKDRTDDRYEQLGKVQGILNAFGFRGIVVLVDRVDEPHLVNGSADQMRALVWPMLDNKLLKHPGLGFKLLLPIELAHYIDREDRDFYQRARLDKQNMIPSLRWTAEALHDVAAARLRGCAVSGQKPTLRGLLDDTISDNRIMDALRQLRVPRHMFKFLYRLFVAHCNAHTDEKPVWKISSETFESQLALYLNDQDAFDRGAGPG